MDKKMIFDYYYGIEADGQLKYELESMGKADNSEEEKKADFKKKKEFTSESKETELQEVKEFKRARLTYERNNILVAIRRLAMKYKPDYEGRVYLETVRCFF